MKSSPCGTPMTDEELVDYRIGRGIHLPLCEAIDSVKRGEELEEFAEHIEELARVMSETECTDLLTSYERQRLRESLAKGGATGYQLDRIRRLITQLKKVLAEHADIRKYRTSENV